MSRAWMDRFIDTIEWIAAAFVGTSLNWRCTGTVSLAIPWESMVQLTVQAEQGRSDPTSLDRDKGPNPLDMRHNLSGNIVYTSRNRSSIVRK